jgi:Cytochrome c554 and c-prime
MVAARLALLLLMFVTFAAALETPETKRPAQKFAGDAACISCHTAESDSYQHTAHHLTSQLPNKDSILGSFREGSNILMIADPATASDNPGLYFRMDAFKDGFYQTAVAGWPGQLRKESRRVDVVVGSGVRGQSYLYWAGEQLFELPVSYWSDGSRWINSPGYKNGTVNFSRAVAPRCLECHTTSIEPLSLDPLTNRYRKESLVVGIGCERCHGPGAEHIARHTSKTTTEASKPGEAILNPATFTRDRKVDLCALCHNGIRTEEMAPAFSFVPGDSLDSYLRPNTGEIAAHPDVHGNQVGLLQKSRCYQSSPTMSCSTCHDVHQPERAAAEYSTRCLSCHTVERLPKTAAHAMGGNCIDCHMPVQTTNAVVSATAGQVIQPKMRNHWIKIYP